MKIDINPPGDWEEAGWKVIDPCNYQHHILEINDDDGNREVMLWLSGEHYRITVGTETTLPNKKHVSMEKYEDEDEAIMEAIKFARKHPTLDSMKEYLS